MQIINDAYAYMMFDKEKCRIIAKACTCKIYSDQPKIFPKLSTPIFAETIKRFSLSHGIVLVI